MKYNMFDLKRYCLLISFNLSVFAMTFLIGSAASGYWITASLESSETVGTNRVTGSLHYGLYTGSMTLRSTETRRHPLYMSCMGIHCVITCKTTLEARLLYAINIVSGYHSKSDDCDDNAEIDFSRPNVSEPPSFNFFLFYGINGLLYVQLMITGLAVLTAAVAILILESKLVHGLHVLMGLSCISALVGLILLIVWGNLYSNTLRHHLAFPYLEAHGLVANPGLGYSYWLVFLAVIFSIGSMVMAFLRAEYLRKEMLSVRV